MKYNPEIHHRKSIRLKGYDYSHSGAYFITICCRDRVCRFGKLEKAKMILNEYGIVAHNEWNKLPERFFNFELDVFQIMPNHMHGIIVLNERVGVTLAVAPNAEHNAVDHDNNDAILRARVNRALTVGDIVGAYKSLVANGCLDIYKLKNETMGKVWQRNYHEHIIRNKQSYQTIAQYIINNPAKWNDDKFNMP